MNCLFTDTTCAQARTCAWNTGRVSEKAAACEMFDPQTGHGGNLGCGSCRRQAEGRCVFTCYRLSHVRSLAAMREEVERPARQVAMPKSFRDMVGA